MPVCNYWQDLSSTSNLLLSDSIVLSLSFCYLGCASATLCSLAPVRGKLMQPLSRKNKHNCKSITNLLAGLRFNPRVKNFYVISPWKRKLRPLWTWPDYNHFLTRNYFTKQIKSLKFIEKNVKKTTNLKIALQKAAFPVVFHALLRRSLIGLFWLGP